MIAFLLFPCVRSASEKTFLKPPNPGRVWPPFCLFSFISPYKWSTNLTINEKSIDGVLGTRIWGYSMVGVGKSIELWLVALLFWNNICFWYLSFFFSTSLILCYLHLGPKCHPSKVVMDLFLFFLWTCHLNPIDGFVIDVLTK